MDAFPPSAPPPGPPMEEPRDLWYVGAIINVIGSIAINLGTNLMKLGHNKRAKLEVPDSEKPPVRKFKEWVIGMSFFSVGNILNFVSFGFAAQSLLAALGSIQFVSNVIFAYFVLHEPINRMVLIATACIVGGCVLLVVFGDQSSATYTVKQLTQLYGKPAYVVYLCLMGVGVVGGYLVYLHGQKMVNKNGPRGFWYAILPVAYSVFSALIGTQSVLFSKSMSVILRLTFSGENQLGNWYTWLVLPLFFATAVFWITRLNKGLRMFPAMIIVPVMQIAWTLFSIVSGMLYFQEYLGFTLLKSIMFPVGVLVVFVGVFLLTQSGAAKQASYRKMEETVQAEALAQDTAGTAFGHKDVPTPPPAAGGEAELARRDASIEMRAEGYSVIALDVEAGAEPARRSTSGGGSEGLGEARPGMPRTSDAGSAAAERTGERTPSQQATPAKAVMAEEGAAASSPGMLEAVKRGLRNMRDKLDRDLLGVEAREGFKQAMGFGEMPAISLFAMPTYLDFAQPMTPSKRYTDTLSPRHSDALDANGKYLRTIRESLDLERAISFSHHGPVRGNEGIQASPVSASSLPRPSTAPSSPRRGGTPSNDRGPSGSTLGRKLADKAERAAKSGINLLKKAPSNLQKAVRDKQGYGSLHDDEEVGLLEMAEPSDVSGRHGERS